MEFVYGLIVGLLIAVISHLLNRLKINDIYSEYVTTLDFSLKEKRSETQRADFLCRANEELQEELNKERLNHNRLYQAHDSLRNRIRRAGDARKYDLNIVEEVAV